jgi:hypothetical protein
MADAPSRDLTDFFAAGIGAEAAVPYDQDDGTLLTETSVRALAVVAAVLDAPATTPSRVRVLTRALRGAVLGLAVLVGTLSAGGVRRGAGLLVLAVGGAMLGIDLLTGDTPAWLTTAGFGILLGGLAYAAVMSRMWVHALLLATPAIPLIVWALGQQDDPASSGQRGGEIVVVAGLVVVLLAIGSVRRHVQPPHLVLLAVLTRLGELVLRWLLPAVGVVVVLGAGLLVWELLEAVDGDLDRLALGLLLACAAGLGGLLLATRRGCPAHVRVATQWAWAYGTAYAVAATVVAGLTPFASGDDTLWGLTFPPAPEWLGGADAAAWTGPLGGTLVALALLCHLVALLLPLQPRARASAL